MPPPKVGKPRMPPFSVASFRTTIHVRKPENFQINVDNARHCNTLRAATPPPGFIAQKDAKSACLLREAHNESATRRQANGELLPGANALALMDEVHRLRARILGVAEDLRLPFARTEEGGL